MFNGIQRVFGAVGFVNQATDSDPHKKTVQKKFTDDLTEGLKQQPPPEVFVFFTNVNLTVGEKDDLVKAAKAKGIAHAEVFDRERIRISLDNPDGLSIRFQYLGIPLSDAEQATFFARWGDDIQGVITDGFGRLQRSLNRILFLQEATLPLRHFTCILELDREYTGSEIGHFRAFATIHLKAAVHGVFSLLFGSTDNGERLNAETAGQLANGKSGISASICGGEWEARIPDEGNANEEGRGRAYQRVSSFRSIGQDPVKTIRVRYTDDTFISFKPGLTLHLTYAQRLKS
jgi:hypothetical protein